MCMYWGRISSVNSQFMFWPFSVQFDKNLFVISSFVLVLGSGVWLCFSWIYSLASVDWGLLCTWSPIFRIQLWCIISFHQTLPLIYDAKSCWWLVRAPTCSHLVGCYLLLCAIIVCIFVLLIDIYLIVNQVGNYQDIFCTKVIEVIILMFHTCVINHCLHRDLILWFLSSIPSDWWDDIMIYLYIIIK